MLTVRDKDVGGLDVAVNDPFCVGCFERVGDLDAQRQRRLNLQRLARNAVLQRHPLQEFHRNEALALVLTDFVDGADIGMV